MSQRLAYLPDLLAASYDLERLVGTGSFANVYEIRSRSRQSGKQFALKVVDKAPMQQRGMMAMLQKEVAIHKKAQQDNPHIAHLYEVSESSNSLFLRLDFCNECLEAVVRQMGPLGDHLALRYLREACLGVAKIHARGILHRDLKPGNMLVDAAGTLRLCDFGWACLERERPSGPAGTPQYNPPEMLQRGMRHTPKSDVYMLGASLQHLLLGRVPAGRGGGLEDVPDEASEEALDLLREMMDVAPSARPSAEELLERPLLGGGSGLLESLLTPVRNFVAQLTSEHLEKVELAAPTATTAASTSFASLWPSHPNMSFAAGTGAAFPPRSGGFTHRRVRSAPM